DAEQPGDRAEERGEGGLADEPESGDDGEHGGDELAGGDVQAGGQQAEFQLAAGLGTAQAAVQGGKVASAAGDGNLAGGRQAVHQCLALCPAGGVGMHPDDREDAGQQGDADGQRGQVLQLHGDGSYLASRVASWSADWAMPNACGMGWLAM